MTEDECWHPGGDFVEDMMTAGRELHKEQMNLIHALVISNLYMQALFSRV